MHLTVDERVGAAHVLGDVAIQVAHERRQRFETAAEGPVGGAAAAARPGADMIDEKAVEAPPEVVESLDEALQRRAPFKQRRTLG